MSKGYIKLHRSLKEWEWYDDANCVLLLVHLLISVNYKDKKWKGIVVKAGSMVLSWATLSHGAKLTIKQCRTAMKKLEDSGEITRQVTNKYQLVTLVKWDKLQVVEDVKGRQEDGQKAGKGQTKGRQRATTKEGKESKEGKEILIQKKYTKKDFKNFLLSQGALEQHIEDWFKVREKKKAMFTVSAFQKFKNECEKNNFPIAEAVKICAENSWSGFKYAWYQNIQNNEQQATVNRQTADTYQRNGKGW